MPQMMGIWQATHPRAPGAGGAQFSSFPCKKCRRYRRYGVVMTIPIETARPPRIWKPIVIGFAIGFAVTGYALGRAADGRNSVAAWHSPGAGHTAAGTRPVGGWADVARARCGIRRALA